MVMTRHPNLQVPMSSRSNTRLLRGVTQIANSAHTNQTTTIPTALLHSTSRNNWTSLLTYPGHSRDSRGTSRLSENRELVDGGIIHTSSTILARADLPLLYMVIQALQYWPLLYCLQAVQWKVAKVTALNLHFDSKQQSAFPGETRWRVRKN